MKTKTFVFVIVFLIFFSPCIGKTNGYLSLEFAKGQQESSFEKGTFQNAWLGLVFSGEVSPKLNFFSEITIQDSAEVELKQAWLGLKPSNFLSFKAGLYLVPFGKYNQSNRPHETSLIQFPLTVKSLYPESWRDLGLLVDGRFGRFFYSAYIGNGLSEEENFSSGQIFRDNNADKGKGGRFGLFLSQELEAAYSYYTGKSDAENMRNVVLQCLDVTWSSEGFQLLSEYMRSEIKNPEGFSPGKGEGYFVQVSFDMKNLHPAVSYQRLKYLDAFHGKGFVSADAAGEGIVDERSRWTIGCVISLAQNVYLKLEYDFNREKDIQVKNNVLYVQAALSF